MFSLNAAQKFNLSLSWILITCHYSEIWNYLVFYANLIFIDNYTFIVSIGTSPQHYLVKLVYSICGYLVCCMRNDLQKITIYVQSFPHVHKVLFRKRKQPPLRCQSLGKFASKLLSNTVEATTSHRKWGTMQCPDGERRICEWVDFLQMLKNLSSSKRRLHLWNITKLP